MWKKRDILGSYNGRTFRISEPIQREDDFSEATYIAGFAVERNITPIYKVSDNHYFVKYREEYEEDGKILVQDFWAVALRNKLFAISFTMRKGMENDEDVIEELSIAQEIIDSIETS